MGLIKFFQFRFCTFRYHKDVICETFIVDKLNACTLKFCLLEVSHKDVGIAGCHPGSHAGTKCLQLMLPVKLYCVNFEYQL